MTTTIEAIEAVQNVARKDAEQKAAKALERAKTRLVLSKSSSAIFFASLAIEKLKYSPCWQIPTAGVDGKNFIYNPKFINDLTDDELIGLICHEVMHCAAKHMTRIGAREIDRFNLGCDLSINLIIRDAGFALPSGKHAGCYPGEDDYKHLPAGLSCEEYYALLPVRPQTVRGQLGGSDPGGCGAVIPISQSEHETLSQQWDASVAMAQRVATQRGTLPSSLQRFCGELLAPVVDWKAALREFITRPTKRDYNWKQPNRRHVHAGLYLPSINGLEIGHVAVCVDTSGSITEPTLIRFASEVNDICAQGVSLLSVGYHHVHVYRVDEFKPQEEPFTIGRCNSGGTSHSWLQSFIDSLSEPPAVVVLLTDMETEFPSTAPDVPVLWASINKNATAPFGELIYVPVE